jgi:transcriptional regulator with XRE-family HTH domain
MTFGARLAEERKRLGLKQAEFAALVGTDVPKQSLYENDRRELRADYLARLADAGVDVVYILTSRRSDGDWISDRASDLLTSYLSLPPDMQEALVGFAEKLSDRFNEATPRTVHTRRQDYRAEDPA